ncbi:MAG: hypothetical protein JXA03_04625 [Bacteroidales bacterium]|nr:hypothetical protein [Bacteroidales bacterium]
MRTVAAILLLSVLATVPGSYFYFFAWHQNSIRKEIKQKLKQSVPEEELVIITSGELKEDPGFRRIRDNEFLYSGKMYDVVRTENDGQATRYYCIPDDKETRLLQQLDVLVKNEMNGSKDKKQQKEKLQRLLFSLYISKACTVQTQLAPNKMERPTCFLHLTSRFPETHSPPPKA